MGASTWSPSPQRSSRPGGAVALLVNASSYMGASTWPPSPQRSSRPGGAVALLVNASSYMGARHGPSPHRSKRPGGVVALLPEGLPAVALLVNRGVTGAG